MFEKKSKFIDNEDLISISENMLVKENKNTKKVINKPEPPQISVSTNINNKKNTKIKIEPKIIKQKVIFKDNTEKFKENKNDIKSDINNKSYLNKEQYDGIHIPWII